MKIAGVRSPKNSTFWPFRRTVISYVWFLPGLNSMPQYNGTFGRVEGFNSEKGRWQVRMELDESLKLLTEKNLTGTSKDKFRGTATGGKKMVKKLVKVLKPVEKK